MPLPFSNRQWSVLLAAVGFAVGPATATSILPPTFEQLVDLSGRVVRATVLEVRPYTDSHEGEKLVRTEITLDVHESWAGSVPVGELKIRHLGGEVEGLSMQVSSMPRYEVGQEMVLFLHARDGFICPTVGWGHGKYHVDRSDPSAVRIRRSNGELLQGLDQISRSIESGPVQARSFDPLGQTEGMTLAQFRQLVRQQLALSPRAE